MKKIIILAICMMLAVSVFAFEKGTKNIGGTIGFDSFKESADADAKNTFTFAPHGGYFILDNVEVLGYIQYVNANSDSWQNPKTTMGFGIGGLYHYKKFYGGGAFLTTSSDDGVRTISANYLEFGVGYLHPITTHVYLDADCIYEFGLGKYGSDGNGDNEVSDLSFGLGLGIYFK
ncbi:MAG TPA: hypothetical protein PLD62_05445 [Candidatus Cloacimonadota bacterium]|nr:hypothetical protein [Candidatus Cloacimonadota bacterium]